MNIEINEVKRILKERKDNCNKGDFGKIGLFGGSLNYSGAIRIANLACASMRSGAGIVRIITDKDTAKIIAQKILEATLWPLEDNLIEAIKDLDVLVIGMGLLENIENQKNLKIILENYHKKLVIDAGALNILANNMNLLRETDAQIVLTPHIKEFSRLTKIEISELLRSPINYVKEFAKKYNIIILLKGSKTIVTNGNETILIDFPVPGLATAGSGDVLSGILGAILGYNDYNVKTIATAAYINALSGKIAMGKYSDIAMIASDTISCIPRAIKEIRSKGD